MPEELNYANHKRLNLCQSQAATDSASADAVIGIQIENLEREIVSLEPQGHYYGR